MSKDASQPATATTYGDYKKLVIDGKTYYKKGDNYYRAEIAGNGEIVYQPIGKTSS